MRIIAKSTLKRFWQQPGCADARGPLESWHEEALKAIWKSPQDVKVQYASASICGNNRVVFNVGGNKYRLVVEMQYRAGIVWVKFIGTHEPVSYTHLDVYKRQGRWLAALPPSAGAAAAPAAASRHPPPERAGPRSA